MTDLCTELEQLRRRCIEHDKLIEQMLGRALRYPENRELPEIGGAPDDTTIQTFNFTAMDLVYQAAQKLGEQK